MCLKRKMYTDNAVNNGNKKNYSASVWFCDLQIEPTFAQMEHEHGQGRTLTTTAYLFLIYVDNILDAFCLLG